jgi:outer membrane lipoprotein-sorting protein
MVRSQENASRYLDAFARKYSSLKDYTADVRVHFDLEALKAPDMQAKLYYKSPDKIKAESKGVFFLPRQGGYFNPALLMPDAFEIKLLDHMTWDGRKAVKLQLIPKDMQRYNQRFVLIIDTERGLILEMDTVTIEGREIKATIDYGKFGAYDLPTHIALQLEVPPAESNESKELIPFVQKGKRVSGKIDIIYSNYAVNSGLSDEIFIRTEPYQLN